MFSDFLMHKDWSLENTGMHLKSCNLQFNFHGFMG